MPFERKDLGDFFFLLEKSHSCNLSRDSLRYLGPLGSTVSPVTCLENFLSPLGFKSIQTLRKKMMSTKKDVYKVTKKCCTTPVLLCKMQ